MRRVGIFGWGIVAPRSPNIDQFAANLDSTESWLEPFNGFGPDNFLVGRPEFDFEAYRDWVVERYRSKTFSRLEDKMGLPVQYAIGAFIQSLGQNPGLEAELKRLGTASHVYIGTGLGDFFTQYEESLSLYRTQRHWNRFWSRAENNSLRQRFDAGETLEELSGVELPEKPDDATDLDHRDTVEDLWWAFWAERSPQLAEYLDEQREIEGLAVQGDVESGKLAAMKEKTRRHRRLQEKWKAPKPPWQAVSANMIWNIDNMAAAQISILGQITGMSLAVGAACSTFGTTLKLGLDAIRRGEAKAVVIGATDPPPSPLTVGAFYSARVISADAQVSKPLTELRGTHISGGSAVWILGDMEHMTAQGFTPLGLEPVSVGVTSDADHIITPSQEGPTEAMRIALAEAETTGADIKSWDLHATATPGDFNEVDMVHQMMAEDVLVTARKGTFGHGMSAGGGWELTAQYLGYQRGTLYPTPLSRSELNEEIGGVHDKFVFDAGCAAPKGFVGKLSMGVGGINAAVISRPLTDGDAATENAALKDPDD